MRFLLLDERLDFGEVLPGGLPAGLDILAGIAEIQPAVMAHIRPQNDAGMPATVLGHADLRAVDAVHESF
jgi:hypothetical protein